MKKWYLNFFKETFGNYWTEISDGKPDTKQEVSLLNEKLKSGNVLDLGSGTGRLSIPISSKKHVIGLDLSKDLLKISKKRAEMFILMLI